MHKLILAFMVLTIALRAQAGLRTLTTNHYRIQTDIEIPLADDLAKRMDIMYDEYSRRLVDFTPVEGSRRFDVYIFHRREDYLAHTGNRLQNTGGIFIPGRALAAFLDGQGRDQLRRTLQHEAFHQFAYSAIGPNLPVWLNEGIAQVFEEGIYDGRDFRIGQVPPRRIRQLKLDIEHKQLFEFESFMALTQDQWAANLTDKPRGAAEYNQAWAMAHFLIFAEDDSAKPRYRSRLIDMLRLIRSGRNGREAFIEAFSDNVAGFQQMFFSYAKKLQPTPIASCIERQDILADMLIELKSQGRAFYDINSFRREIERGRYQVEYTRGAMKWKSEPDPGKYFRDLEGKELGNDRLYLVMRLGTLPDIISRPTDTLQLHTRFSELGDKIDHEIVVEPPSR